MYSNFIIFEEPEGQQTQAHHLQSSSSAKAKESKPPNKSILSLSPHFISLYLFLYFCIRFVLSPSIPKFLKNSTFLFESQSSSHFPSQFRTLSLINFFYLKNPSFSLCNFISVGILQNQDSFAWADSIYARVLISRYA